MAQNTPPSPLRSIRTVLIWLLVPILIGALALFVLREDDVAQSSPTARPLVVAGATPVPNPAEASPEGETVPERRPSAPIVTPSQRTAFERAVAKVMAALNSPNPEIRREALEELRELLESMPATASIELTLGLLRSGVDRPTGLPFQVTQGSKLADSPSLRVFLIDELGRLCKKEGTSEADQYAREIMSDKGSPDEWAISMRNVVWHGADSSREYIAGKSLEMLQHAPWVEKPTHGFLHAMDGLVYGKQMESLETLNEFVSSSVDNPLHRAGETVFLRMADEYPAALVEQMNNAPGLLSDDPKLRAEVIAKLDITDRDQLIQLETYLHRQDVPTEEKEAAVTGLLAPLKRKFFALMHDPAPFAESGEQARQRWNNIEKLVTEWEEAGLYADLGGAFDTIRHRAEQNRLNDQMNEMQSRHVAKHLSANPKADPRTIPPLKFTSLPPADQPHDVPIMPGLTPEGQPEPIPGPAK